MTDHTDSTVPTLTDAIALEIERKAKETGATIVSLSEEYGYKVHNVNNRLSKIRALANGSKKRITKQTRTSKRIPAVTNLPQERMLTITEHKQAIKNELSLFLDLLMNESTTRGGRDGFMLGRIAHVIEQHTNAI